jgi:hypothetical protein
MAVKSKTVKKLRNDNKMSLLLCLRLDIPQATLFMRIDRKGKAFETLFNDIRVIEFLKEQGFSDEELFETDKVPYKSISNN